MSTRQVVKDAEHHRVFERVAAVDVAKKSGMVCTRMPGQSPGSPRVALVWEVPAMPGAVRQLASELAALGVQMVTLESTSDYWRVWHYLLAEAGLRVQLVTASQARQLSGRPKTDRHDAMWLARLTELGLLRPSFVPPADIRVLRNYTRARIRLVQDRTRAWQRMEKLLEDALIKLSSVASKLTTQSSGDMIRAMIDGERDPQALAALARGRMKAKHDELVLAFDGMFNDSHSEVAQLLLDQIRSCDAGIARLNIRIAEQLAGMPASWGVDASGETGPGCGKGADATVLPAITRLAQIPGMSAELAAAVIAEIGLDMSVFPTAGHLSAWAGLAPQTRQSGPRTRKPKSGQGDTYLRGVVGQAAIGAARTDTFTGERYRRIARHRGASKAQVATARAILEIIWHLLADPARRYVDLGSDWHLTKINQQRKMRNHIRELKALGYEVTLTPAA